jgi:signal transduction histidine kinase
VSSNGSIHWISEIGRIYIDEDNSGYIDGVINDITSRKELELEVEQYRNNLEQLVKQRTEELEIANEELKTTLEQLNKAQFQLIQSEKMASLGILTAGFAHEINNPLNYIMGGYVALQEMINSGDFSNPDANVLLQSIKEGVDRAAEIVKSLNQISTSNGIFSKSCDIHRILDNCLAILHYRTVDKIEIFKQYTSEISCIEGNTGQLHQVFLNILLNAIQAIKDKGTITISTQINGSAVKVDISDTGCGICSENLSRVFDPFFTTKPPGKGTGLGLTICYSILNDHKGTLEISSEENKGTTVSITFPLVN